MDERDNFQQQETPEISQERPRQPVNNGFPPPPPANGYNGQQPYNNFQQRPNSFGQTPPPYGYEQPRRPVYDRFMYEPIGFEELNKQQNVTDELSGKKRRPKSESRPRSQAF